MDPGASAMTLESNPGVLAMPRAALGMAAQAATQMIMLPWNAFASMATAMARMAGGIRSAAAEGAVVRPPVQAAAMGFESTTPVATFGKEARQMTQMAEKRYTCDDREKWEDCDKEYCKIKLFRYTIVSIQRGRERILFVSEQLVVDPMDECEFDNFVIAKYVRENPDVPARWLRVCSTCVCSWDKPSLHYEEKQLRILERISRQLGDKDEDEDEQHEAAPVRSRAAKPGGKAEKAS